MTWAVVGLALIAVIEFAFLCLAVSELMEERKANMHLHTLIDHEMKKSKQGVRK